MFRYAHFDLSFDEDVEGVGGALVRRLHALCLIIHSDLERELKTDLDTWEGPDWARPCLHWYETVHGMPGSRAYLDLQIEVQLKGECIATLDEIRITSGEVKDEGEDPLVLTIGNARGFSDIESIHQAVKLLAEAVRQHINTWATGQKPSPARTPVSSMG